MDAPAGLRNQTKFDGDGARDHPVVGEETARLGLAPFFLACRWGLSVCIHEWKSIPAFQQHVDKTIAGVTACRMVRRCRSKRLPLNTGAAWLTYGIGLVISTNDLLRMLLDLHMPSYLSRTCGTRKITVC